MNDAEKILQELKQLNITVDGLGAKIEGLDTKVDQQGETLNRHGKLLSGLTGSVATVLEDHGAQRADIRSLHTELHASTEELREEIISSREEAKRDNMDLKATVIRQLKDHDKRINDLEDATGIPNPNKH